MKLRYIELVLLLIVCSTAIGQEQDTIMESKIFVEHANSTIIDNSAEDILRFFVGDVRMYHDSVYMFCDSSVLRGNTLTAIGNVTFVQADTIKMFADSLVYFGDQSTAFLYDNVTIENGDKQLFTHTLVYNTDSKIATYQDTALLKRETTRLQSIKGRYNINEKKAVFFDQVIVEDDDLFIRTDSLEFNTEDNKMIFVDPTRILQKERKIYCESGFYNLDDGQALFTGNAQFIENDKTALADEIHYLAKDSTVLLSGNAVYTTEDKKATADKILYDDVSQETTLMGNAYFKDSDNESSGDTLIYNESSESLAIRGKGFISDAPTILTADRVDFDDISGKGIAKGNVVWKDTSANSTIYAEVMYYNNKSNKVKAEGSNTRPYMMKVMEEDTTYLAADTLFSYEVYERDTILNIIDSARMFAAYYNVNILKSDLKSNCDSLIYNESDSIFQLFHDPVVWSDTTQFSGDSIFMFLKDSEISKIEIRRKSFIINNLEPEVFNQIKGKNIDVYFEEGDIDYMDVSGSAESLYFMQDDSMAYIGVNKTLCSRMRFLFENVEMQHIKFYSQPESVLTPIKDVNPLTERLDLFNWQIDKAPINLPSMILWKEVINAKAEVIDSLELNIELDSIIQEGLLNEIEQEDNNKDIERKKDY